MGLWGGDTGFKLPGDLPALPKQPETMEAIEVEAINRRLDLLIARHDIAALAQALKLNEATRYVSMLQLAGLFNSESANPLTNFDTAINRGGVALDFDIPIFDTGEAKLRSARETYMRALNRLAGRAVNARSEARIAYDTYRGTYDIARFYESRVLPLRDVVSRQIALRYTTAVNTGENMRVDLFKVLVDTRIRITAAASALDARRDFSLAEVDLQAALTFGGGSRGADSSAGGPGSGSSAGMDR
jgi:outer membrane protein TolC